MEVVALLAFVHLFELSVRDRVLSKRDVVLVTARLIAFVVLTVVVYQIISQDIVVVTHAFGHLTL